MQAADGAAGASGDAADAAAQARRASRLRTVSILLLIAQSTVITLLARETRIPEAGKPMYLGGAAVLASELIKLPVCLGVIAWERGGVSGMLDEVWQRVFVGWRDTLAMGIPALLFCFQNLLFFVSVSNLSATSYQLWSQSKTLTTALFFVVYLGGKLRTLQWLSLGLLCGGVGMVSGADLRVKVGQSIWRGKGGERIGEVYLGGKLRSLQWLSLKLLYGGVGLVRGAGRGKGWGGGYRVYMGREKWGNGWGESIWGASCGCCSGYCLGCYAEESGW
jgi:multidrug transporter EmrE-like cation transporter